MSTPPPLQPPTDEDDAKLRSRREATRASAIGLQFVISITVGLLGGQWLDTKLGTAPWLLLLGLVLGATAAFRDLYRLAKKHAAQSDSQDPPPPAA